MIPGGVRCIGTERSAGRLSPGSNGITTLAWTASERLHLSRPATGCPWELVGCGPGSGSCVGWQSQLWAGMSGQGACRPGQGWLVWEGPLGSYRWGGNKRSGIQIRPMATELPAGCLWEPLPFVG